MYHKVASSKSESPNEDYYQKRKQEISKNNFKSINGYSNPIEKDSVRIKDLKRL